VGPGEALAYLLTSPSGSIAIIVTYCQNASEVALVDVRGLRSTDLAELFIKADMENEVLSGYLVAHAEADDALAESLGALEAALGNDLLKPLAKELRAKRVTRLCLVPIMLLGVLPLHAMTWEEDGQRRRLLDDFTVTFAPSAFVRSVCRSRVLRRAARQRTVVIGNPAPHSAPLPGAEFEARLVADTLAPADVEMLLGRAATKENVLRALEHATLAHFACHGAASVLGEPSEAALSLANNEPLLADDVLALDPFSPRLVVASACESGVVQGYAEADETLTFGAMFIAAGAAGVVATLWSIDDDASALLISRFYELLAHDDIDGPAHALRGAQLWLRDLTVDDEQAYLDEHAALRARRGERHAAGRLGKDSPYSSILAWGAFVFSGA
jgi:CHAT domain-containing protein